MAADREMAAGRPLERSIGTLMTIAENIARIRANMAAAAREAGRDPKEILLVGASKMNDAAACREAVAAGIDALGENRVQEMVQKLEQHAYDGAPLHFIGHLQRNKVKQVVGHVALIQSVGSLELLDEIEKELQIQVTPLSWPIGNGDQFKGIYNIHRENLCLYSASVQTIQDGIEINDINSGELDEHIGERPADKLREDLELVREVYPAIDREAYLNGQLAPVFFGSALNNFGIREMLDCFIEIAPSPLPRETDERLVQPDEEKFTGFVFKIHANMDPNHRDRIAFVKVCSGVFRRNTNYLHVGLGKNLKFSTPTAFMASKKSIIDEAYPGDIVGLHDTGNFKIGDTLTEGEKLHFKGIPSFSPELFKYIENADPMKSKQLAKGVDQLMDEGVAQLFTNQFNNRKIIGTVGALQFEVIEYRLLHEYGAACRWENINLYKACWIEALDPKELEDFRLHKAQYMARDKWGRDVFLAESQYMLQMAQVNYKKLVFHFTSEF